MKVQRVSAYKTGKSQHGFKKKRSTTTLSLTIQTIIAQALDDDCEALMASIDLTAAFDMVNVDLLLNRMGIMGLPPDLVSLVSVWLKQRSFYISIDGENSTLYEVLLGTVQGSVLGPVLYAIFISPIYILRFSNPPYPITNGIIVTKFHV